MVVTWEMILYPVTFDTLWRVTLWLTSISKIGKTCWESVGRGVLQVIYCLWWAEFQFKQTSRKICLMPELNMEHEHLQFFLNISWNELSRQCHTKLDYPGVPRMACQVFRNITFENNRNYWKLLKLIVTIQQNPPVRAGMFLFYVFQTKYISSFPLLQSCPLPWAS